MLILIFIVIAVASVVYAVDRSAKSSEDESQPDTEADELRKQQIDEEIITFIQPTIENDK